jgi:hypothetical protein
VQDALYVREFAALCEASGVPCRVVRDLGPDLWMKLAMNCAFNAVSALGGVQYGAIAANDAARETVARAVEEAQAVARAAGIKLPEPDLVPAAWKLAAAMPQATSSTAQDLARGRPTEIDALNGYVARPRRELGVPHPGQPGADRARPPQGVGPLNEGRILTQDDAPALYAAVEKDRAHSTLAALDAHAPLARRCPGRCCAGSTRPAAFTWDCSRTVSSVA